MEAVQKSSIMQKCEQIGEGYSKEPVLDELGTPWYGYDEAPKGIPYRQVRYNGGLHYELKDEFGKSRTYWGVGNPKENFNQSIGFTGIPLEYRYKTSKDFMTDIYKDISSAGEAKLKTRNYIKEYKQFAYKGIGLYMYSPSTGSGKTLLACLVANGLIKTYGENVRFIKAAILFEDLKREFNGFNRDNPQTNDKLKQLQQTQVLIIDDLGAEKVTDFINTKMYELISRRYDLHKVTIFTSRKEIKQLKYDTSIVAAINRSCIPIFLPNEDVASKLASEENKELEQLLNQV